MFFKIKLWNYSIIEDLEHYENFNWPLNRDIGNWKLLLIPGCLVTGHSFPSYDWFPLYFSPSLCPWKDPAFGGKHEGPSSPISGQPCGEDQNASPSKLSKEELIQSMDRVDREIAKVEQQILKLKKKQVSTAGTALGFCQWERCGKTSFGDGEFFGYMNQMKKLKRKSYMCDFILNKLDVTQF